MANKKVNFLITAKDQASKVFRVLNSTMKMASKTVGGITKALGKFTLVAGATATAVTLLSKRFMDQIDSIDKVSKKIGVTADFLQKLRFASEVAGIEITTTDMALQRFTRRMAEAKIGTGEALGSLQELGVAFFDNQGFARDTEDVFLDVARALNNVDDDATKLRLAFKLFDSEGVALVNTMSVLIDQFEVFEDLGLGLDNEAINKVVSLKDNLTEVQNIVSLIGMSTFAGLSDEIDSIVTLLKEKVIEVVDGDVNKFAEKLGEKIKQIVLAIAMGIQTMLNAVVHGINEVANFIQKVSDKFNLGLSLFGDPEEIAKRRAELQSQIDTLRAPELTGSFLNDALFSGKRLDDKKAIATLLGFDPNDFGAQEFEALAQTLESELEKVGAGAILDTFNFYERFVELMNNSLSFSGGEKSTGSDTGDVPDTPKQQLTVIQEQLQKYKDDLKKISQTDIADSMIEGIKSIEDSFVQLFEGSSQGFIDLANSIKTNFIRFLVQEFITSGLLKILSSFGINTQADSFGGRLIGSLFGRATGGTLMSGQSAIVGEHGAEIITANQDMTVKPANQTADILGNMGGTTVNFNITTNDASGFDELLASRKNLLVSMITQSMNQRGKPGLI